ncbi:MAG TPA: glycosyltransferase family 39 protein [Acidimicrobiales bacterium]|nr:glycosyltransferase family 39 protein [Acidimicrobiales bacterium]
MGAVGESDALRAGPDVDVRERVQPDGSPPRDDRAGVGVRRLLGHRLLSPANRVALDRLALVGVVLGLAFLWGRARGVWYWGDEGLAIGIASHPLADIPGLLRQDGSPPLYYLILNVWMSAFGSAEASTHALSVVFALGTVVAAWWVGRSLFGRRVGWLMVALAAVNPLLALYANETRMYTLMVLLATLATGAFVHVFVFGRRRYLPLLVSSLALLLYTHNWALFFALGMVVALVPCLLAASDRRRLLLDAVFAFGAAGLLYVPWIPTLLYQRAHTAAPWAFRPTLELARTDVMSLLGAPVSFVAAGLGAGLGLTVVLRRRGSRPAVTVAALAVLAAVAISVGWVVSRSSPVWAYRYLGVVVPVLLLVVALGLAAGGRLAVSALCVLLFLEAPIDVRVPPFRKSNVKTVAVEVSDRLRPGDLVVSHFGELPVLDHYLPPGLRYASASGVVPDPSLADYRDSVERLQASVPAETLPPLLDEVPPGGHALLVCPLVSQPEPEKTPFLKLLEVRCDDMKRVFANDARFRIVVSITGAPDLGVEKKAVDAFLYSKSA